MAGQLTAEEVEAVAEAVPAIVDGLNKARVQFGLLGAAIGAATAALVTYAATERKLRAKYEALAEEEISQMREHFHAKVVAMEGKPALDGLVKDLGYAKVDEDKQEVPAAGPGEPNTTVETESETKNVFEEAEQRLEETDPDAGWDYETEVARRNPQTPYVIHRDEQGERGFSETTFTYYEGDDVLCDERDKIVDARDDVLGAEFVDKFGHGSGDPNVVYIRNEELAADIEVCRSPNSYAEEVHGFKHSDEPRRVRRSSPDDE